jgi:hypothetical protein
MAWIDHGPVSIPSNTVVGLVALAISVAALGGLGFGVKASWRDNNRPAQGSVDTQATGQAIIAQPIVELPQPQAPPVEANAAAAINSAKEVDDSAEIAAKTAAAQAVQSKPAQSATNIDDILTSPSEKPQAPAKPSTDEAPPTAPKSDVPF